MGHVRKAPSGRWKGEYRNPAGKIKSKTFDLKRDASAWVKERETEVRRGRHVDQHVLRMPLGDYINTKWWPNRVAEATTLATNQSRVFGRIMTDWGRTPTGSIAFSDVKAWVKRLSADGMAPWTVHGYHSLLRSILESARRDGILPDNPARGVALPTPPPGEEAYLTEDEVWAVAAEQHEDDAAVTIGLAYTGTRWGEFTGAFPRQLLPLHARRFAVSQTLVEVGAQKFIKDYPKGRRNRTVPIADPFMPVLADYMGRNPTDEPGPLGPIVFNHMDRRFEARPGTRDCRRCKLPHAAHVGERCPGPGLSRHSWPRDRFYPALCRVMDCRRDLWQNPRLARRDDPGHRCRGISPHDLRHTFASWLVQDGVKLYEVAKLLGDTQATTERYAHLAPDTFDVAIDALEGLSRRRPGVKRLSSSG